VRNPSILGENSLKQYNKINGWDNQFYKQIALRIDKFILKKIYSENGKTQCLCISICKYDEIPT